MIDPILEYGTISGFTDHLILEFFEFIKWAEWVWLFSVILTTSDLVFGIKAAKKRGESVRISRAVRRTMTKMMEYVIWIVVAYTLGQAFAPFGFDIAPFIVILIICCVDFESAMKNYFESKGKKVEINIVKFFTKKDASCISVTEDKKEEVKKEEEE